MSSAACLLLVAACAAESGQTSAANADTANAIALAAAAYYQYGSCVRSHKEGSELGKLTCSRAGRARCRVDGLYDSQGLLQVTSGTRQRYSGEWSALVDDYPDCNLSFLAALNLKGFRTTSGDTNTKAGSDNVFSVIADCSSLGNANIDKLADSAQYDFLLSPRGVLAWQARLLSATACFNSLVRSDWERKTAEDFATGALLLETTCFYGSNAVLSVCTSAEKAQAARFDFVNAL